MFCNPVFAETWSCLYEFDNDKLKVVIKRNGNEFSLISGSNNKVDGIKIIKENNYLIHLYTHVEFPKDNTTAFLILLDKTKKSFVMVGLEYKASTEIVEGGCIVS
ncbi:hypothetical protein N9U19_02655 [Candidatus Pelagibacter sp.]|nr:hypothetical protein [Candidatus Pelagibacter sp.]